MVTKKEDTTKAHAVKKPAAKPVAAKKPRVLKKKPEEASEIVPDAVVGVMEAETAPSLDKPKIANGKYVFATGRRKTSIANVRMFSGKGENIVNKKPFATYFFHTTLRDQVTKPFKITGFQNDFYFVATINGGGINSQSVALQHGLARALASLTDEAKRQLKKNGLLTRDARKKERKKPGLKRARRSPQWAKR